MKRREPTIKHLRRLLEWLKERPKCDCAYMSKQSAFDCEECPAYKHCDEFLGGLSTARSAVIGQLWRRGYNVVYDLKDQLVLRRRRL